MTAHSMCSGPILYHQKFNCQSTPFELPHTHVIQCAALDSKEGAFSSPVYILNGTNNVPFTPRSKKEENRIPFLTDWLAKAARG